MENLGNLTFNFHFKQTRIDTTNAHRSLLWTYSLEYFLEALLF